MKHLPTTVIRLMYEIAIASPIDPVWIEQCSDRSGSDADDDEFCLAAFSGKPWTSFEIPFLEQSSECVFLLPPVGFAYHLPAFLISILAFTTQERPSSIVGPLCGRLTLESFQVTDMGLKGYFEATLNALSQRQKVLLACTFQYLDARYESYYSEQVSNEPKHALRTYWSQYLSADFPNWLAMDQGKEK